MKKEGTVAILSYLTPLGWVLAYLLYRSSRRSSLAIYHIRQSLGLHILVIALIPVRTIFLHVPYGASVRAVVDILWAALALAAVQGALKAYEKRQRPLPLIGEFIQEYLRALT